jgi:hypothetical protein
MAQKNSSCWPSILPVLENSSQRPFFFKPAVNLAQWQQFLFSSPQKNSSQSHVLGEVKLKIKKTKKKNNNTPWEEKISYFYQGGLSVREIFFTKKLFFFYFFRKTFFKGFDVKMLSKISTKDGPFRFFFCLGSSINYVIGGNPSD